MHPCLIVQSQYTPSYNAMQWFGLPHPWITSVTKFQNLVWKLRSIDLKARLPKSNTRTVFSSLGFLCPCSLNFATVLDRGLEAVDELPLRRPLLPFPDLLLMTLVRIQRVVDRR